MPSDTVLQRQPLEVLHDDEGLLVLLVNFVNGANIGMIERRSRARLPLKALQRLRVRGDVFRKKFEGDEAAKLDVLRLIDDTHTATAELFDDAVMRDGLADHES